ncbi:MAG: helix-turn-helix transcriptional regulator [Ruminococcus sp.]|nr:helix-turn-helix transcriptional regulator [Ruminococcus sp.]
MKFSENLVKYRKKAGLTQSQLASALLVTPQAVSKWEKGSYPDSELLPTLSKVLDVSLDVLFGLKEDDGNIDVHVAAAEKLQKLPPEEKGRFFMEQAYSMLCAYNQGTTPENIRFPEYLKKETYACLRSDNELAVSRLNPDMQYLCFMRIPQNGIDSYFELKPRITELFGFLADENALRIICYAETLERNFMFTKECIAKNLSMPIDIVSDIIDRFDHFGIMWQLIADTGEGKIPVYGYVHNVPLVGILTLAESLANFLSFRDPDIDIWTKAPFRKQKNSQATKDKN